MKIQIGELIFPTKAEATEHFRAMLHRYELGEIVNTTDTREFLWLLERHPTFEQKRGAGVLGFIITRAPYNSRGFSIMRADWSSTDFSYRKCIEAPPTIEAKLIKALRKEVEDDILRAKREYFALNSDSLGRVSC